MPEGFVVGTGAPVPLWLCGVASVGAVIPVPAEEAERRGWVCRATGCACLFCRGISASPAILHPPKQSPPWRRQQPIRRKRPGKSASIRGGKSKGGQSHRPSTKKGGRDAALLCNRCDDQSFLEQACMIRHLKMCGHAANAVYIRYAVAMDIRQCKRADRREPAAPIPEKQSRPSAQCSQTGSVQEAVLSRIRQ